MRTISSPCEGMIEVSGIELGIELLEGIGGYHDNAFGRPPEHVPLGRHAGDDANRVTNEIVYVRVSIPILRTNAQRAPLEKKRRGERASLAFAVGKARNVRCNEVHLVLPGK